MKRSASWWVSVAPRDAVVLSRMMCEAVISYSWLTNKDSNRRFDRYVYFLGKVQKHNIEIVEKYFGYHQKPTKREQHLIRQTEKLFRDFGKQWNNVTIGAMAQEADAYETQPDGSLLNRSVQ